MIFVASTGWYYEGQTIEYVGECIDSALKCVSMSKYCDYSEIEEWLDGVKVNSVSWDNKLGT